MFKFSQKKMDIMMEDFPSIGSSYDRDGYDSRTNSLKYKKKNKEFNDLKMDLIEKNSVILELEKNNSDIRQQLFFAKEECSYKDSEIARLNKIIYNLKSDVVYDFS